MRMLLIVNTYTQNEHLGDYEMNAMGEYLKKISGIEYMSKRFNQINGKFMKENPQIKGIIIGGNNCVWDNLYFDIFEGLFNLIRTADIPILGICAGHHLIAMAYDADVRRVAFGKEERFFTEMTIGKDSVLTQNLNKSPYVFEYHYWEVTELPEGFEHLLSSKKCRIQAMKKIGDHKYGVQFHPELDREAADPLYRATSTDDVNGEEILLNFLSLLEE